MRYGGHDAARYQRERERAAVSDDDSMDELRQEVARLTAERDAARSDVLAELRVVVDEALDNARGLAAFGGDARVEARCRALAAMYLDEALQLVALDDHSRRLTAWSDRTRALVARVDALLAEVGE